MSMTLISMLFEALHGIVKCTGLDVLQGLPSGRTPNTESLEGR